MDRRVSKFDIVMMLSFILLLAVGVGAFFFGLHTGKTQSDAAYESIIAELMDERNQHDVAYHQQQLVSFYHTVLLPFGEFQEAWFQQAEKIGTSSGVADAQDLLKELGRLAADKSEKIKPTTIPEVSPLLRDAQSNYLKSLSLFAEAAKRLQSERDDRALSAAMKQDAYVLEAANYALKAQSQFYEAIWEWNKSVQPELGGVNSVYKDNITLEEWRNLNLNAKNVYVSRKLLADGAFASFYPQDVTSRIDEMDDNGKLDQLRVTDVNTAITTLLSTGAVRANDYLESKNRIYKNETLPLLPFF